ncbi:MAG: hypothetical protein IKC89_07745 [Lentisphaeria bacterium]|nr:hypothetical protein [Lentisphaeria bacterium]
MVKWISHRGESYDAPENTLAAFRLSLERGTDGMECDVHLTADGQVAVGHDNSTARMGSAIMDIESSTYADLQKISVSGSFEKEYPDEKIPLLSETFKYLGEGREYYIELKGSDPALIPAVKKVVEASGIPAKQIVFISFSEELISGIKAAMPEYCALWLNGLRTENGIISSGDLVAKLEALGVDGIDAWCHPEISCELVKAVHDAGKIFAVWTVDNPAHAKHLIALGVDAVTSNRAALLKNW